MLNVTARVVYFLHLHKAGGTTICSMAKAIYATPNNNNCNVPRDMWYNEPFQVRYQHAAYFGNSQEQMTSVYENVLSHKWEFAANEGSLEDAFPFKDYFYITVLRNPIDLYISAYLFMPGFGGGMGKGSRSDFRDWLDVGWYGDNFMTRRLCGHACNSINYNFSSAKGDHLVPTPLSLKQYERAVSNLRRFDVVMTLESLQVGINKLATLRPEWRHTVVPPRLNAMNPTTHQWIRDDPVAMKELSAKIHFDSLLYNLYSNKPMRF